jgi:hypothetical protein
MATEKEFAVCLDNSDYPAALEVRKVYQLLPDPAAQSHSYVRVIDESGEDYLYPSRMFLRVRVRPEGRTKLLRILSLSRKGPKTSKGDRERQTSSLKRSSKRSKTPA